MSKSIFADRVKTLRLKNDMSQTSVAHAMGITPQSVQQWESGKSLPRGNKLERLAGIFGVSASSLLESRPDAVNSLDEVLAWDKDSPVRSDEIEIPIFKEVELADKVGVTQVVESPSARLRFSRDSLRGAGVSASDAACCYISGSSMEPLLPDGALVAINKGETVISDGKLYAVDQGGMLRVKFLYRMPRGEIRIKSANAEYADEHCPISEVRVIGRVFWFSAYL